MDYPEFNELSDLEGGELKDTYEAMRNEVVACRKRMEHLRNFLDRSVEKGRLSTGTAKYINLIIDGEHNGC